MRPSQAPALPGNAREASSRLRHGRLPDFLSCAPHPQLLCSPLLPSQKQSPWPLVLGSRALEAAVALPPPPLHLHCTPCLAVLTLRLCALSWPLSLANSHSPSRSVLTSSAAQTLRESDAQHRPETGHMHSTLYVTLGSLRSSRSSLTCP